MRDPDNLELRGLLLQYCDTNKMMISRKIRTRSASYKSRNMTIKMMVQCDSDPKPNRKVLVIVGGREEGCEPGTTLTVVEVGQLGGEGLTWAAPGSGKVQPEGLVGAQGGSGGHLSNLCRYDRLLHSRSHSSTIIAHSFHTAPVTSHHISFASTVKQGIIHFTFHKPSEIHFYLFASPFPSGSPSVQCIPKHTHQLLISLSQGTVEGGTGQLHCRAQ